MELRKSIILRNTERGGGEIFDILLRRKKFLLLGATHNPTSLSPTPTPQGKSSGTKMAATRTNDKAEEGEKKKRAEESEHLSSLHLRILFFTPSNVQSIIVPFLHHNQTRRILGFLATGREKKQKTEDFKRGPLQHESSPTALRCVIDIL